MYSYVFYMVLKINSDYFPMKREGLEYFNGNIMFSVG
jgi:hypothetical protein